MASVALPIIGGAGGFMLGGGGFGATLIGARLGFAAAGLFSSSKSSTVRLPAKEGPRLADLRIQVSSYEQIIPQLFGTMRFSGNIIWHQDIKEHIHKHTESSTQSSGGKGGGGRRSVTTTQTSYTYSYSVTLAIAICAGPVDEITRIWADSDELFVLLNSSLTNSPANTDMINRKIIYKPVSISSSLAETENQEFTYTARNLKPFAPVYLKATHDNNSGKVNISIILRADNPAAFWHYAF